jgi:hypothetical protein
MLSDVSSYTVQSACLNGGEAREFPTPGDNRGPDHSHGLKCGARDWLPSKHCFPLPAHIYEVHVIAYFLRPQNQHNIMNIVLLLLFCSPRTTTPLAAAYGGTERARRILGVMSLGSHIMLVLRADRSVVNLRPRNSILESVSFYELHFMSCNMIDLIEVNVCIRTTAVTSLKCLYTGYCFHSGVVADGVELTVHSANYITDSWSIVSN